MPHQADISWLAEISSGFLSQGIGVSLASYALGCFTTGYYLVRFSSGRDIRQLGSGSAGARNVGRHAGVLGFGIVLIVDLGKGALSVWGADHFTGSDSLKVVAMVAVVCGHIWPVQLGFHGGKGMASAGGALLVFDPMIFLWMSILCLGSLALSRKTVFSGLLAFALGPILSAGLAQPGFKIAGISSISALVLLAHRKNLLEEFCGLASNQGFKTKSKNRPH